jgi:hypothetical protein
MGGRVYQSVAYRYSEKTHIFKACARTSIKNFLFCFDTNFL